MRKLYCMLALMLATSFMVPNVAHACVVVTNTVLYQYTPNQVKGLVVQFLVDGYSPNMDVYLDANYLLAVTNLPNISPPGVSPYYRANLSTTLSSYGSTHTLSVGGQPTGNGCSFSFINVPDGPGPYVDSVNVTSGSAGVAWGYWAGNFGLASPALTSTGYPYGSIADNYSWTIGPGTAFAVCGFSSDPGTAWLTSIAVGSTTKTSSAASYNYSSGCASWAWSGGNIGISYNGVTQVTVTHY